MRIIYWLGCFLLVIPVAVLSNNPNTDTDSLKAELKKAGPVTERIRIMNQLAWAYRNYQPDSAIFYGNAALKLAMNSGHDEYQSETLSFIGLAYRTITEYDSSMNYFREALKLAEKRHDTIQIAYGHNNIGGMYRLKSTYFQALNHILKAYHLFEQVNDRQGMIYCAVNLGVLYRYQHDYQQSYKYLNEAMAYRKKHGDERGLATVYSLLAENYFEEQRYHEAMKYYRLAGDIFAASGGSFEKAANLNGKAGVCFAEGKTDTALKYRQKALMLAASIDAHDQEIRALIGLAKIAARNRQFDQAIMLDQQAIQKAKTYHLEDRLLEGWLTMTHICTESGDPAKALTAYQSYIALKDTIFNNEKSWQLAELQTAFETHQKTVQLNQQQQEIQAQKIRIWFLVSGMILILTVLVFLYFYYSNKLKMTRILKHEKQKVDQQKETLLHLNKTKDDLMAIIAHDLRNPFQAMLGLSEVLYENEELQHLETVKKLAGKLNQTAESAYTFLETLLNWSKVQFNQGHLEKQPVNIEKVIDHTFKLFEYDANEKKITLNKVLSHKKTLLSDENILFTALRNLVSNAIKFTPQGGSITIHSRDETDKICIDVTDTGVGIAAENLDNIFDKLPTVATQGTNHERGTGLGLSLCRNFITLAGGTISVQSRPGKGSTFTICLPIL